MRYYELFEASYDSMVIQMRSAYPEWAEWINNELKRAKSIFKKDDRVAWIIKYIRAGIQNTNEDGSKIDSNKPDILNAQTIVDDLGHFFGIDYKPIQDYVFGNKTYDEIINDLNKLESKWKETATYLIEPKEGDYELIKFQDGSAWWFVDRAYCSDEGRSGKHCGNVMGKHKPDQRILSYRQNNRVILTFILEPGGFLGEMKATANQKPQEKYHPYIMALLLNDRVKGIRSGGYQPALNFSVFDLNEKNLKIIEQQKPELIDTQLESTPLEILKAPDFIRKQSVFRNAAIIGDNGIKFLINENGDITGDLNNWEKAVEVSPSLIIHAPAELNNYKDKVVSTVAEKLNLIPALPDKIKKDFELMSRIVLSKQLACLFIAPNTPKREELQIIGVTNFGGSLLEFIDNDLKTEKLCLAAIYSKRSAESILAFIPKEIRTPKINEAIINRWPHQYRYLENKTYELTKLAVSFAGDTIKFVPEEFLTNEIIKLAVNEHGRTLAHVPEKMRTKEICDIAVSNYGLSLREVPIEILTPELCLKAIKNDGRAIEYVPSSMLKEHPEWYKIAVSETWEALIKVPVKFRTKEICEIALKQNRIAILSVPINIIKQLPKDIVVSALKNQHRISLHSSFPRKEDWEYFVSLSSDLFWEAPTKFREYLSSLTPENKIHYDEDK